MDYSSLPRILGWPSTPVRGVLKETMRERAASNEIKTCETISQKKIHVESSLQSKEIINTSCNDVESREVTEVVS